MIVRFYSRDHATKRLCHGHERFKILRQGRFVDVLCRDIVPGDVAWRTEPDERGVHELLPITRIEVVNP